LNSEHLTSSELVKWIYISVYICAVWQAQSLSTSALAQLKLSSALALWQAQSLSMGSEQRWSMNSKHLTSSELVKAHKFCIWQAWSLSNHTISDREGRVWTQMIWQAKSVPKHTNSAFDKIRACQSTQSLILIIFYYTMF